MDILLSNIPAITFGMWVIHKTGIRKYDWFGREGKDSIMDWECWQCHKRMGGILYQQALLLIHFLAGFFLNNAFLIPPKHFFPIARLLLWFGFGAMGHREGFIDVSSWNTPARKDAPVEGRYRWLSMGILLTEALTCYKYREGTGNIIDAPTPIYVWLPWTATFVTGTLFWVYLRFKPGHSVMYPGYGEAPHEVRVVGVTGRKKVKSN